MRSVELRYSATKGSHASLIGIQKEPLRKRPAPKQYQSGNTTAGAQVHDPQWGGDHLRQPQLERFAKPDALFDVSVDRPRTEVPQLASPFQAGEEGTVR